MPKSNELTNALKQSDPEVQGYVSALESENARLQSKIAKLEVQNLSAENRVSALQQELKDNKHTVILDVSPHRPDSELNIEETLARARILASRCGYEVVKAS